MNTRAAAQVRIFGWIARRHWATYLLLLPLLHCAAVSADTELERNGEYVFQIAGCAGCHTAREKGAVPLAGGRSLETAFGVYYSPNITPHPEHGIGRWTDGDLARALREGVSPGGVHLYPVFPYTSYAGMLEEDIRALSAYLRRVPASDQANPAHDLPWYLRIRSALYLWKLFFHSSEPFEPRADRSAAWNRGAYLAKVLGHCGECHTPRNFMGVLDRSRDLAGNSNGSEGEAVPNITSHPEDGIGDWSAGEIGEYLRSGYRPDGDVAGGVMAEIIDESLRHLTGEDRVALVEYLMTVPAVAD